MLKGASNVPGAAGNLAYLRQFPASFLQFNPASRGVFNSTPFQRSLISQVGPGFDQAGQGPYLGLPGSPGDFPQGPISPEEIARQQAVELARRKQDLLNRTMQQRDAEVNQPINYGAPKPVTMNLDVGPDGLQKVGGSANIILDPNQTLRMGGRYLPGYVDSTEQGVRIPGVGRAEIGYSTPSVDFNVNYTGRRRGEFGGDGRGGFGGDVRFNSKF
jgi:hypothetical protein